MWLVVSYIQLSSGWNRGVSFAYIFILELYLPVITSRNSWTSVQERLDMAVANVTGSPCNHYRCSRRVILPVEGEPLGSTT